MRNAMRLVLAGAVLGFASLAGSGGAAAEPLRDGGVTAQEVAGVLRTMKLPVQLTTDKEGDPLIYSNIAGQKFGVYFYQCKGPRCGSIQFSAGFEGAELVPNEKVADWNRTKRFGRAYLSNGTLYVEMDMDVEHGATTEALANNLERWRAVAEQFPKYFK